MVISIGSDYTKTIKENGRVHTGWMEASQHTAKILISMSGHVAFDSKKTVISETKNALTNIVTFAK